VQWISQPDASASTAPSGCTLASAPDGGLEVDYTVGVGCADTSGSIHIPVCNRGSGDAPTTGFLYVMSYSSNPNSESTNSSTNTCANPTSGSLSDSCIMDLSKVSLKSNTCIEVTVAKAGLSPSTQNGVYCTSTSSFSSGNRVTMINPPTGDGFVNGTNSISTIYGASTYTQLAEVDSCNNQSFVYAQTGSCAAYANSTLASTYQYTYTASCPAGTHVSWNQLAYDTTVPTQSDIMFSAATAAILTDGGTGGTDAATTNDGGAYGVILADPGASGGTDPAVCPFSGPSPCPVSLSSKLGTGATNEVLTLTITLTGITSAPTLNSFGLTYDCPPSE
jgi:hypothetical protein